MPTTTICMPSLSERHDVLERLRQLLGPAYVLTAAADTAPYLTDWRGRYQGAALAVLRPGSVAEVQGVVRLCAAVGVPMVPQGGNTSLCGAATPDGSGEAVVISLGRLNRILEVDTANDTLTLEAGCTLAQAQAAAQAAGRLFPLALASAGSCQIGGNLSTNAGGVQVLRYGNTRDLTLGLQVVLPNGELFDGLRGLRKDNTGYDLKQLFIGAEGTLGIITAAVLKLYPLPETRTTCWLEVESPDQAVALLNRAKHAFDAALTAFELVSEIALGLVVRHIPGAQRPGATSPWYVLAEFSAVDPRKVEDWLAECLGAGAVRGGTVATSEAQTQKLWALRENISEAQKREGISIKHDISLPLSRIAEFIDRAGAALATEFPGSRVVAFGHVGDGNLHYNLSHPETAANAALLAQEDAVNRIVYDLVHACGGSISAEHGLGQLKRSEILRYKSPVEIELMRSLKKTIDVSGLMNPGKSV